MAEKSKKQEKIISKKEVVVTLPVVKAPHWLQGFVDFIREQGVVGLAVGLVLGVASKSVVDSIVANIFNPLIALVTGGVELKDKAVCLKHGFKNGAQVCQSNLQYGAFLSDLMSFVIVAAIVYFVVKGLKLDRLDKKKA